jgi:3-oxoacyl-[acyl-carrier protein] reductase
MGMAKTELDGRVALVTGGSRGIGRAVCLAIGREGAHVAINYASDADAAARTRAEVEALGVRATTIKADVSREDEVAAMVAATELDLGPVDLLVTSAGIAPVEPLSEVSFASWRRVIAVNLDGTFLSVMAVREGMVARGYGRIVCIASIAGLRARPQFIHYGASKAGVIALVRSFAVGLAPDVRVNCVAPGLIETDMAENMTLEVRQAMVDEAPLGRIGRPEDISELVLFLLSERSSFTTGQTVVASGGRVMLP